MDSEHDESCFTLIAPSESASLSVVRGFVESVSKLAGHDDQARYETVLAVNEACSNIINHAHGGRPQLWLNLECRVSTGGLEIRLRDNGAHFDLTTVPDIDPKELRRGGRGVYIIRRYMDEFTSVPHAGGGNELRMLKRTKAES